MPLTETGIAFILLTRDAKNISRTSTQATYISYIGFDFTGFFNNT